LKQQFKVGKIIELNMEFEGYPSFTFFFDIIDVDAQSSWILECLESLKLDLWFATYFKCLLADYFLCLQQL
jgi:hypothetical protein